jgi:glycosyltransferase A (GT-A) superfamily protein (DUF2064 family)
MKTLIIFAKAPLIGTVKTRLAADTSMTDEQVLMLYEAFLYDTFTIAALTTAEMILVHFTPKSEEKHIRRIINKLNLHDYSKNRFMLAPQHGETFTDKIRYSFNNATDLGGDEIVMIGSDSPLLKPSVVEMAFDFLCANSGMSLGPSGEGGVYLIGLRGPVLISFDGVFTCGTELENLALLAKEKNLPLQVLPENLDVDLEADLITLVSIIRATNYSYNFPELFFPTKTALMIEELGITIERSGSGSRGKSITVQQYHAGV